jgi:hypothetical protein
MTALARMRDTRPTTTPAGSGATARSSFGSDIQWIFPTTSRQNPTERYKRE